MSDAMRLVRITAGPGEETYIVTLAEPDGAERDYEFSIDKEESPVLYADDDFGHEVDMYGRSDLIYKAVWAFREARKHVVGRPESAYTRWPDGRVWQPKPARRPQESTVDDGPTSPRE